MITIALDRELFRTLLIQSFRYCLGRKTYAVGDCVETLTQYWRELLSFQQKQIQEDITRAILANQAGMQMDVDEWKKILLLKVSRD